MSELEQARLHAASQLLSLIKDLQHVPPDVHTMPPALLVVDAIAHYTCLDFCEGEPKPPPEPKTAA